ncbi:MAG: hypothetical protein U0841_02985 [Chloroflexia bacterium]
MINVILDDDGTIVAVAAGDPETVHDHLVEVGKDHYLAPIPHQYDAAIAGVGWPKDVNLYQASRAATYLHFAPTPVVREGASSSSPPPCPKARAKARARSASTAP